MTAGLTPQMARVLGFIREHQASTGVCPSFAEIASGVGLKSRSGVHDAVLGLEERGAITCLRTTTGTMKNRGITIIEPKLCPHCGHRIGSPLCLNAAERERLTTITRSGAIPQQARA